MQEILWNNLYLSSVPLHFTLLKMSSAEEPGISDIRKQPTALQLTQGISRFIAVNLCILSNAVTYLKEQQVQQLQPLVNRQKYWVIISCLYT